MSTQRMPELRPIARDLQALVRDLEADRRSRDESQIGWGPDALRRILREDIIQFVKRHHPYAVPETIFTEIDGASRAYQDWIGANTIFTTNIPKDKATGAKEEL